MKIHMSSGGKNMACVTDNVRNDIVDIQRRLERETTMQTAWIILTTSSTGRTARNEYARSQVKIYNLRRRLV
jgi:hypothetical protein